MHHSHSSGSDEQSPPPHPAGITTQLEIAGNIQLGEDLSALMMVAAEMPGLAGEARAAAALHEVPRLSTAGTP